MNNNDDRWWAELLARLIAQASTATAITPRAAATDALLAGIAEFARAADNLKNKGVDQLKGDLFEFIEAAKFNADAMLKGQDVVALLTRELGAPGHPADMLLVRDGQIVGQVQAKVSATPEALALALREPKYDGMQKLVPAELAGQVRRRAAHLGGAHSDTAAGVTGELRYGSVRSGGTTHDEAEYAAREPAGYRRRIEADFVASEMEAAAAQGALSGVVVGGALSLVRRALAQQEAQDPSELARAVALDAMGAGLRGGATGALAVKIRVARAGRGALARPGAATAVAGGLVESLLVVWRCVKGEISPQQAATDLGEIGCSTMGGISAAAASGALLGPAGALLGSLGGYLVSSNVYRSCVAILSRARLAEAEAARAEELCRSAVRAMEDARRELEAQIRSTLARREAVLSGCLAEVDAGLAQGAPGMVAAGSARLAAACGGRSQFASFGEFDDAMANSDDPFEI